MKNLILVFIYLFSFCSYSQFGVSNSNNTYNVYIIEKPKPNPYGTTMSTVKNAEESGRVQSALQQRYDYNYERFSNSFTDINNKIYALNLSRETKNNIIRRWRAYVSKVNNLKINFTNTSQVTQIINNAYEAINTIYYEETEYEEEQMKSSHQDNTYSSNYKSSNADYIFITTFDNPVFEVPLREKPISTSKEIYKCPKNATVFVLDNSGQIYIKVRVDGYTGYVSKAFLKRQH